MNTLPKQLQNDAFNFIYVEGKNPAVSGKGWQKQIHSFHEAEKWLSEGKNYGVMGGHGGLLIMDADSKVVEMAVESQLPATFTVQSGSGKKHYYFLCPEVTKKITLDDNLEPCLFQGKEDHYGEGITWGGQAVGPGSIHPETGNEYKVFKDLPITYISKEQIIGTLAPFLKKIMPDMLPSTHSDIHNKTAIESIKITDVVQVNRTGNIVHPVHGSKGGGNLNIDIEKNLWHCFRCESGGGPLSLIAVMEGIIDCSEAIPGALRGPVFVDVLKKAEEKYGLKRETPSPIKKEEKTSFCPSMSFGDLMSQEFPAARFVLDPYFETNAVNMVSAPPNTWKSWLLFLVAGSIASGDSVWNFKTEQSSVMIVNEEDTFRAVQDRFKLLDITDKSLPIYFHIAQGLKIDKTFTENIIKEMKEKSIKTLMLDSLRSMHDAEENDSTEMQVVLDHLKEIARNEITVIFTHHHRKRHPLDKQQSADASRGSSAINAAISGHISLDEEKRENGTFLIIHHLKSKAGPKIEPVEVKITKSDLTGLVTFDYQGTFKSSNKKIEVSKDVISQNLKEGGWMSVNDFIELEIASDSIIRAALRELKKTGVAMTMTRADAKAKGITVNGEGRANELIYAWCEGKDNELDTLHSDLQTIDPNEVPI